MKLPPKVLVRCVFLSICVLSFAQVNGRAQDTEQLIRRADSLQEKGQNSAARDVYDQLLRSLRQGLPSQQLGHVLNAKSQIELTEGSYESAANLAQQAADIYRALGDTRGEARAYSRKGIADVQIGAYSVGQRDFETALSLARNVKEREIEVQTLNNLGSPFYLQGKYYEALRSYDNALRLIDTAGDANWTAYWRQITNFNQATLYQRLGRYQKALQIYREVQAHSQNLMSGDRAHVLANLGTLYRRLGDPWKALENYRAAQVLYSTAHDADGEISVLKNIGIVVAMDNGDFRKAESIFRTVQSLAKKTHNRREEMQAHLYLGETLLRANSMKLSKTEFEAALSLSKELQTAEEQWKAGYGIGRIAFTSGDLKSAEAEYRQAVAIIEESRSQLQLSALRAEFLADKRDVYDSLIDLLLRKNDVSSAFAYLERSRARTFQDRIGHASSNSKSPFLKLDEIRSYLEPSTVLLEFWTSGDRVAMIWCKRSGYGALVKDFSSEARSSYSTLVDHIPEVGIDQWRNGLAELSRLLPGKSAEVWNETKHVVIVPDGWLSVLPFELLPASDGGDLLLDHYDVSYLPSAVLLRRSKPPEPRFTFPWSSELVAFGSPVIRNDAISSSNVPLDNREVGLPGSAAEIRSIAHMAPGKSHLFLRGENLKRIFFAQANAAPLLHVSSHAFADGTNPENSRILFTAEDQSAEADYLFLRELYTLDLGNIRLATISGCETERGANIRGEGVQAFSRALLSSGARASVTTLWRVDDAATAEFMKQFYFFAIRKRQPLAQALQQAKLKFLHSHTPLEHPRYWAAFVLNGEGQTTVPAVITWARLLTAAVLSLCIFTPFWFRSRNR